MKLAILVLWPSFIVGGIGEVIFFTVFDPRFDAARGGGLLALQYRVDREPALVIVVGHQTVGGGERHPGGDRAGHHYGRRSGHQDPGPGFAVPGVHAVTSG